MNSEVICQTPGCGKEAKLQCPKCLQLGFQPAWFCSQECFKGNWNAHKAAHGAPDLRFNGFEFTGKLRPGIVSPMRKVPDHIVKPDWYVGGIPLSERSTRASTRIPTYNAKEIEGIRKACKIGREVLDIAGRAAKVGMTTDEIDRIVHDATIERGAYPSPLNYNHFPKSVCTSVNEIVCHGIPDSRPLEDGDILNIDVSVYIGGFHADLNETFLIGNVDEQGQKLVRVTRESLEKAIATVKPGVMYRDIGTVIEKYVRENGFSVVRTYCGHGIGSLFHDSPSIPHYGKNKAIGVMKPGHVFTIEPMINEGGYSDVLWPDDWTSATKDGKRSAQFEHTLLVTETGVEILTK